MGSPTPPPQGDKPAEDPLDLIYVDQGTNETVFELAIRLSKGIRGSVVIRVSASGKDIELAINGQAARYLANRQGNAS